MWRSLGLITFGTLAWVMSTTWSASARRMYPSAEPFRVDVGQVLEQRAFHLVQHRRRDPWLEKPTVERGEHEVAGDDWDEEVGVESGDADRGHP